MAIIIETQKSVERSVIVRVIKNLSASHNINMFITTPNNPKVNHNKGVAMSLNTGATKILSIVRIKAPTSNVSRPPLNTKPGK